MDLRHFETFLKIAEHRSFTKAAEDLCLTQPTVSKQIVDLERFFEVKLIDRTKRTVALTKAGEILIGYARDLIGLKKDAVEAIASFKGLKMGSIVIGASTIPGTYILPKVLSMFKKKYDGIGIKLIISDTKNIIEKMEEGVIDIGFVGAKSPTGKIDFKKFVEDTIAVIAPPEFPGTIPLKDLKEYPLIARESGSGTRNNFESSLKKSKHVSPEDLKVVAELTDTEAIKEAVKAGMGLAYISNMAVAADMSSGKLKRVSIEGFPEIRRSFFIIARKGKTALPQVRALTEMIDTWRKHEKM
ncbi:MAG TPA: selenium metabolism-associated LysR family transcriptional regulator [Syntrophorhabdaceae bacterium]|nr:selenium metabolism-associated LysR family transcriptional regulator [Syntrophorhabdaceae bacterium]